MSSDEHPELSVIVPTLNEAENLPALFECLCAQRSVRFELIVSDGLSTDDSVATASALSRKAPFPCSIVSGRKGRAAQLNRGVAQSGATLLLFLHADSSFDDPLALRKGIDAITSAAAGSHRVAGHFALRFAFPGRPPLPYRYYQEKARLDRPGCTHGDQGFLISRNLFDETGPFDETLPLMEDTFLAEKIRKCGRWLLLPSEIVTSPRRFQREGLLPRQTLNAVLMNLAALGRLELCADLRSTYQSHDAAGRLSLARYLLPLRERILALPPRERLSFWYETGSYVRRNAWQVPLFFDVLLQNDKEGGVGGQLLARYDRYLEHLTDGVLWKVGATFLVWGWFTLATLYLGVATPTPCSPERSA